MAGRRRFASLRSSPARSKLWLAPVPRPAATAASAEVAGAVVSALGAGVFGGSALAMVVSAGAGLALARPCSTVLMCPGVLATTKGSAFLSGSMAITYDCGARLSEPFTPSVSSTPPVAIATIGDQHPVTGIFCLRLAQRLVIGKDFDGLSRLCAARNDQRSVTLGAHQSETGVRCRWGGSAGRRRHGGRRNIRRLRRRCGRAGRRRLAGRRSDRLWRRRSGCRRGRGAARSSRGACRGAAAGLSVEAEAAGTGAGRLPRRTALRRSWMSCYWRLPAAGWRGRGRSRLRPAGVVAGAATIAVAASAGRRRRSRLCWLSPASPQASAKSHPKRRGGCAHARADTVRSGHAIGDHRPGNDQHYDDEGRNSRSDGDGKRSWSEQRLASSLLQWR